MVAKLRATAALWASTTTAMAAAVAASWATSPEAKLGIVRLGSPAGTSPIMATPRDSASIRTPSNENATTATRAAGNFGITLSMTSIETTTPSASNAEATLRSPRSVTVSTSLSQVVPEAAMPSIPGSLPMIRDTPTPLRNPASTGCEIRSARNPSRATAMSSRKPAVRRPNTATVSGYLLEFTETTAPAPAATSAAVAESAPTTSCRVDARIANRTAGSSAQ